MSCSVSRLEHRTWVKAPYLISTNSSLIPVPTLNKIFSSDEAYWAKPLPEPVLLEMLQNSLCFGLYRIEQGLGMNESLDGVDLSNFAGDLTFVGIACCITDFTTFIYLTDVYIYPENQGKGLGT